MPFQPLVDLSFRQCFERLLVLNPSNQLNVRRIRLECAVVGFDGPIVDDHAVKYFQQERWVLTGLEELIRFNARYTYCKHAIIASGERFTFDGKTYAHVLHDSDDDEAIQQEWTGIPWNHQYAFLVGRYAHGKPA